MNRWSSRKVIFSFVHLHRHDLPSKSSAGVETNRHDGNRPFYEHCGLDMSRPKPAGLLDHQRLR
jgi:hypothetical protein